MAQQGQVFELKGRAGDGKGVWAYRYRVGGRDSKRVQRGGFASEQAAAEALERMLESATPASGFSTEAVHTPARVNVTCVTPLGEEAASIR